jgi:hypothetical protein
MFRLAVAYQWVHVFLCLHMFTGQCISRMPLLARPFQLSAIMSQHISSHKITANNTKQNKNENFA